MSARPNLLTHATESPPPISEKAPSAVASVEGTLKTHLMQVQEEALAMMERLTEQMAKSEGVTEELKAKDQMAWVRRMNNIRNRAEEIVNSELIYA